MSASIDSVYLKNSGPEYGCHECLAGEFVSEYVGVDGAGAAWGLNELLLQ